MKPSLVLLCAPWSIVVIVPLSLVAAVPLAGCIPLFGGILEVLWLLFLIVSALCPWVLIVLTLVSLALAGVWPVISPRGSASPRRLPRGTPPWSLVPPAAGSLIWQHSCKCLSGPLIHFCLSHYVLVHRFKLPPLALFEVSIQILRQLWYLWPSKALPQVLHPGMSLLHWSSASPASFQWQTSLPYHSFPVWALAHTGTSSHRLWIAPIGALALHILENSLLPHSIGELLLCFGWCPPPSLHGFLKGSTTTMSSSLFSHEPF